MCSQSSLQKCENKNHSGKVRFTLSIVVRRGYPRQKVKMLVKYKPTEHICVRIYAKELLAGIELMPDREISIFLLIILWYRF